MGIGMNRLLDIMHLNDEEMESGSDIEDIEDEEPAARSERKVSRKKPARSAKKKAKPAPRQTYDDIDDDISDDDEEDSYEEEPESSYSGGFFSRPRRSSKIVPMNASSRNSIPAMEVCVSRPVDFESCQEISDIIRDNKAAIVNIEAVSTQEAQRIIDFVSGSYYALDGAARQVSDSIIIFTPNDIDITGDFLDSEGSPVSVPGFDDDFDIDGED